MRTTIFGGCRRRAKTLPPMMALALVSLGIPSAGLAQNTNSGDIQGVVRDPSGAVIPGAHVAIRNVDTGVVKDLTTNNDGIYDAVSILPGNYQLTFDKPGFGQLVRNGVELTVGVISIDAQLTVGSAQQRVEVTEAAPLLNTENAQQGTVLESKSMQQLPNVGQSWGNFTKMLPGAAGSGTGVAVNGNMPYYTNFLADGANVSLPHSANVDTMVFEDVAKSRLPHPHSPPSTESEEP
jgi:Carboxypeptidase regulatory-like domain